MPREKRQTLITHSQTLYHFFFWIVAFGFWLNFAGCNQSSPDTRFQLISADHSGLRFSNDLEADTDFNILNYLYFYDGGGVSVGDINKDGMPDIYMTANMLSNRLYLNKGNFKFEDITKSAGVAGEGEWTSGSTMADVNGDGYLDIYVTNVNYLSKEGRNELYINNGDSTFTESAARYGLDFKGYSKHATFFDYDLDGDLDLYLLNHAVHTQNSYRKADARNEFDPLAGDRLFRNEGSVFTDVTEEAGIYSSSMGYGLAVTAGDINTDGCPDLYISNDFHENDYIYVNNCDGTFREVLQKATGHTSRASMGNDIGDINNDLRPDVVVLDMLPYNERVLKSTNSAELYNVYKVQRQVGYHPQYTRNTLQLNQGVKPDGVPFFSEIAQFAGVDATDWSWAPLLFDIDNNGFKDLVVTNGIYRRPNNMDFLAKVGAEKIQKSLNSGMTKKHMKLIEMMPQTKIPNVVFRNNGNLTFTQVNDVWGLTEPSYSSGMAYGDLDSDGDLDLVINNVNSQAQIYKNTTVENGDGNYLKIKLEGAGKNTDGLGSKVIVHSGGRKQLYEQTLTRGFLSSVPPAMVIGLDSVQVVDSLTVIWPDRRYETLTTIQANQTVTLEQQDAAGKYDYDENFNRDNVSPLFAKITDEVKIDIRHWENDFTDFDRQRLMPHMLSREGPPIAKGDVNGDGLDDFFVGGAKYERGRLFVQQAGGKFKETNRLVFRQDEAREDVDATFFDVNGDGSQDLYVVSGGNEYSIGSLELQDRIYFNDGEGNFVKVHDALPPIAQNGSVVAPADYDRDGDMDLFIGSRSVPHHYGVDPYSYLLENMGNGSFREVTEKKAPELVRIGMVTDAVWNDANEDGYPDLMIAGEWMPLTLFENKRGQLQKSSQEGLSKSNGWWNVLRAGDFDRDGDVDFIAGNLGLNTAYQVSAEQPQVMYINDFNKDGQFDPVIGYTKEGAEYPVALRDEMMLAFTFLREKLPVYEDYAGSTIREIFGDHLEEARKKKIYNLTSSIVENTGDGTFVIKPLPKEVQLAPVRAIEAGDFNQDGYTDLLLAGNFFPVKPVYGGRYDASYGWLLTGKEDGSFTVVNPDSSGFIMRGQVQDLEVISSADEKQLILVARNDDRLMVFEAKNKKLDSKEKTFSFKN